MDCIELLTTWQLASHRINDLRETETDTNRSHGVFYNLISEMNTVFSAVFYWSHRD